jgi:hypothetical protein
MSERRKSLIAFTLMLLAMCLLFYWTAKESPRPYDFNPRADSASEGQCP